MKPILRFENISKTFPGAKALDHVSFDINEGEVHALLGENGAGKSTLIKILSGVHKADTGTIYLDDQPVSFNNPRESLEMGISTMYQELSLYPELTIAENIFMGHAPKNRFGAVDWPAMRQRSWEILDSLNIHDLDVNMVVGRLNVGNRQRVEIAKALSQNARILIMDEPTAALTESDVERLFDTVRLLRQRSVSIIYISHRLQEIFELADRVTVLRDGQYVGTKPVSETQEPDLISMMVGRTIDNLFPKLPAKIGDIVLEVRDLWRRPLTRGVSFNIRAGEIVGLSGLVGSGRSETVQVIFGIFPADSGQILLNGQPITISHPGKAMQHGIAYVPEDRGTQGLVKQMRVRENLSMAILRSMVQGIFIDQRRERELSQDAVRKLNIRTQSIDQIVSKLSGGNQQKVVMGKWLAAKPRLLIIDEPTRGIDVGAKAEIHRLLSEMAQQGIAILMISSELPEILGMSDRVYVMREGQIVAEFTRDEADQERIATAMMSNQTNGSGAGTVPTAESPERATL